MKSSGAIRQKFKQARYRAQKVLLQAHLDPRPQNCMWNEEFLHPKANGVPAGICTHSEQDQDRLCDELWGGCEKARSCPLFEAAHDKDSLKEEFKEFLATATLGQVAKEYPDLAALLWVLDEEAPGRAETANDWEEVDTDPGNVSEEKEPEPVFPVTLLPDGNPSRYGEAQSPVVALPPETLWQKLWGLFL